MVMDSMVKKLLGNREVYMDNNPSPNLVKEFREDSN